MDPFYLLVGQDKLFEGPVGGYIHLSRNPRSLRFLFRGKFPLPRDEKVFVLLIPVAGILKIQLDELSPLGLEVVYPKTPRIPLNPIYMHELFHG